VSRVRISPHPLFRNDLARLLLEMHGGLFRACWGPTLLGVGEVPLTIVATTLLLLHQFTAAAEAARLASATSAGILPDVDGLGSQLVFDAGAAVLVLPVTTTLSIYKPWGRTRLDRGEERLVAATGQSRSSLPVGLRIFLGVIGAIIVTIMVVHLAGGGMGRH
jgi:hypothetical protein